jgi:hypothetical protein
MRLDDPPVSLSLLLVDGESLVQFASQWVWSGTCIRKHG